MQTLTSIWQRGRSGRIASFPLSGGVFFSSYFWFFAKATGRTVRPIGTNQGSKRVVPLKEVPFGGLKDVSLNFWGKIPKN